MNYEKDYFKPLKKKVLWILKKFPETRNSDKMLFIKIVEQFYSYCIGDRWQDQKFIALDELFNLPHVADIARIRRQIQHEDNMYLPTSLEVAKARKIKEEIWRLYIHRSKEQKNTQLNLLEVE